MATEKPVKIQIFIFRHDTLGKLKGVRTNQAQGLYTMGFDLPLQYNLGNQGYMIGNTEGADDNVDSIDNILVEIPVGNYKPKSLVDTFQKALEAQLATLEASAKSAFGKLMELSFKEMKNRLRSRSLYPSVIVYYKEDDAARLFGLPLLTDLKYSAVVHFEPYEFPFPPLSKLPNSLYIYTDIIDNDLVGDALVPLLRAVNVADEAGAIVHKSFDLNYYKRVIRSFIPSIEIQINSETGALVNFDSGEVICVLHFRKQAQTRHKQHH